ncbi:hypothetical protein [Rubrivivax gelatinosus]|uniref:hypothetical protein n=1 Tax=Rubrivivax gelatinosus TaxID=28068 RepID=UPI0012FDE463|nr:hypothetical protein [Rubrivivax gelatinosus]MBG6083201.1 hypothetical protein [Rubrivivax gelatinosus]
MPFSHASHPAVVLVDSDGAVVQSGSLDTVRSILRRLLEFDRSRYNSRYACLVPSKPIDRVQPGDVVEIRAGRGGALWDRFSVFPAGEWSGGAALAAIVP